MWLSVRRKCSLHPRRIDLRLAVFAKPKSIPSFAGLRSCGLTSFRRFEAKAFLSEWLN